MAQRRAFSLVELLIVIFIVTVLAALLFPVFVRVKQSAGQVAWAENIRQVSLSTSLYINDYDDRYMVARYNPEPEQESTSDRTWVQAVLPYIREFDLFICPADGTRQSDRGLGDPNVMTGDSFARFYEASMRSNIGYNFIYLSPIYQIEDTWLSSPKTSTSISNPAQMLMFGETAWEIINGYPSGGGHYLIIPPCRFEEDGRGVKDSFGFEDVPSRSFYTADLEWNSDDKNPSQGGLYAWYRGNVNIAFADGHMKALNKDQLVSGCDVKENWEGFIKNSDSYIWDNH